MVARFHQRMVCVYSLGVVPCPPVIHCAVLRPVAARSPDRCKHGLTAHAGLRPAAGKNSLECQCHGLSSLSLSANYAGSLPRGPQTGQC